MTRMRRCTPLIGGGDMSGPLLLRCTALSVPKKNRGRYAGAAWFFAILVKVVKPLGLGLVWPEEPRQIHRAGHMTHRVASLEIGISEAARYALIEHAHGLQCP